MRADSLTGKRVLILVDPYMGSEGTCLGRAADGIRWAISPDRSDQILQLHFDTEFGVLAPSQPH